jgi:NAD dependent epimerase/dehydratase family enzyme
MKDKLWIIGCGDIGLRLANLYLQQQTSPNINALVSSMASKNTCESIGIHTTALNLDNISTEEASNLNNKINKSKLFYFVPPPRSGREDTRFKQFLSSLSKQPKRIVLISTTGVYGDSKGDWIDEKTAINPQANRAYRRLSAEKTLHDWGKTHQREYIILRVPGIYAKDRLPLARLKKGLPVVKESEAGWSNRIHADDLAMICKQAMKSIISGEIYNVTDGHPSTMTEYFNQVADYAHLPHPPQISMQQAKLTLSAGMVSYLQESRRISSQKIVDQLGIKLRFPNLKKGLI